MTLILEIYTQAASLHKSLLQKQSLVIEIEHIFSSLIF